MAYDEGLAQVFRDDLVRKRSITEKKMFGGLCFMHRGHMLCGVHKSKDKSANTLRLFRPAFYDLNAYFACGQHLIQARPFERRVNVVLA